jgi:hypothetical protein
VERVERLTRPLCHNKMMIMYKILYFASDKDDGGRVAEREDEKRAGRREEVAHKEKQHQKTLCD